VLSPDLAAATEGQNLLSDAEDRVERCRSSNRWDRLMYFYCKGYLGDDVLPKVDRASMAVALEVRAPMLDRRVIDLACRIAPRLRMSRLTSKRVLKRAARGLIPNAIIDRPKKGFGMPIAGWLGSELRDYMEDSLSESRLEADGLFSPDAVRRLIDQHVSKRANHRKPLWTLLAFQAWLAEL
jgi:asparagine synthase (glutamine-hydrolysing)